MKVGLIAVLLWLVASLYLGLAGWVGSKVLQETSFQKAAPGSGSGKYIEYQGLTFRDEASLADFVKERTTGRWFPWIFEIPSVVTPLLAGAAFGAVGGACQLLKKLVYDHAAPGIVLLLGVPLFGAVVGVMLYLLSLVVPAALFTGNAPVRTETLVGLTWLGGVFSEQAYKWIESQAVKKIFSVGK